MATVLSVECLRFKGLRNPRHSTHQGASGGGLIAGQISCSFIGVGPRAKKVDVRLPGTGNSNSHGARPVHLVITMIKWTPTIRLSTKKSLSGRSLIGDLTQFK